MSVPQDWTDMLEKDIQKQIMEWLEYRPNCFVWRQNAGMRVGKYTNKVGQTSTHAFRSASVQGISDIIGIWHGRPLAIEVKQPKKEPTPEQRQFLDRFRAAGGIAIVAHSLDEVMSGLLNESQYERETQ